MLKNKFMTTSSIKTRVLPKPIATDKINPKQSELSKHLQEQFGFDAFKRPQEEIIQSVLNGKDTFVIMPTGGGKIRRIVR